MKFRIVKIFEDDKWVYRVDQWFKSWSGGYWSSRDNFFGSRYGWEYKRYKTEEDAQAAITEFMKGSTIVREIEY